MTEYYITVAFHRRQLEHAPEFTKRLKTLVNARTGEKAHFECIWSAFPRPAVKWYHDDEEINTDDVRFEIESLRRGVLKLTLKSVTKADEGSYKCKAENQEGVTSTTGYLTVTGDSRKSRSRESRRKRQRAVSLPPHLRTITEQSSLEEREEVACSRQPRSPIQDFIDNIEAFRKDRTWPLLSRHHGNDSKRLTTAQHLERGDDPDGCVSVGFQKQDVTRFGLWTAGCILVFLCPACLEQYVPYPHLGWVCTPPLILTTSLILTAVPDNVSHPHCRTEQRLSSSLPHRKTSLILAAVPNDVSHPHCRTEQRLSSSLPYRTTSLILTAAPNDVSHPHCRTERRLSSSLPYRTTSLILTAVPNDVSHPHCRTEQRLSSSLPYRTTSLILTAAPNNVSHPHCRTEQRLSSSLPYRTTSLILTAVPNDVSHPHCRTERRLSSSLPYRTTSLILTAVLNNVSHPHCRTERRLSSSLPYRTTSLILTAVPNNVSHPHCRTERRLSSSLPYRTTSLILIAVPNDVSHPHCRTKRRLSSSLPYQTTSLILTAVPNNASHPHCRTERRLSSSLPYRTTSLILTAVPNNVSHPHCRTERRLSSSLPYRTTPQTRENTNLFFKLVFMSSSFQVLARKAVECANFEMKRFNERNANQTARNIAGEDDGGSGTAETGAAGGKLSFERVLDNCENPFARRPLLPYSDDRVTSEGDVTPNGCDVSPPSRPTSLHLAAGKNAADLRGRLPGRIAFPHAKTSKPVVVDDLKNDAGERTMPLVMRKPATAATRKTSPSRNYDSKQRDRVSPVPTKEKVYARVSGILRNHQPIDSSETSVTGLADAIADRGRRTHAAYPPELVKRTGSPVRQADSSESPVRRSVNSSERRSANSPERRPASHKRRSANSSESPVRQPVFSIESPVGGPVISSESPAGGPVISNESPVHGPVISGESPAGGPIISNESPMHGAVISNESPMHGAVISSESPARGSVISSESPMHGAVISNESPMHGAVISNESPMHGAVISSESPARGSVISNKSPLRPPVIATKTVRVVQGPAKPAVPGPAKPAVPGLAKPAMPGLAKPAMPGPAKPARPGPAKPAVPGPAKPAVPGPAKPAMPAAAAKVSPRTCTTVVTPMAPYKGDPQRPVWLYFLLFVTCCACVGCALQAYPANFIFVVTALSVISFRLLLHRADFLGKS
ncbi:hypothetical protein LSAT2_017627 [Lamellibrachia satsuma]|nr:hypothetical protein LSAT2_017627 [Lamellibrachia satsuma]